MGNITGEWSVNIGGSDYTIATRYTNSGTPIEMATQYVFEFMQALGLSVSYHDWTYGPYTNRNVIGEIIGSATPDEIVLVTAHLDSLPSSGLAPGADDNGSGSVGVMMAAQILSQYDFQRTVRFVFFTGEEQGLYGSDRYASKVVTDGDNLVAVYNMDMIAWDNVGGPTLRIYTRTTSNPGYDGDMVIANTFVDVVNTYALDTVLTPIITSEGGNWSDHASFWDEGFPAVCAIEDDYDDWNGDNYHTANDKMSTLNFTYLTNYIKASVGTTAHFAPEPSGVLQLVAGLGLLSALYRRRARGLRLG
jgi:Zn-dependent M28 family amino/carboxypeptidase